MWQQSVRTFVSLGADVADKPQPPLPRNHAHSQPGSQSRAERPASCARSRPQALGFEGTLPAETGRPSYLPAVLLKIYIYGYLNRVQSTRRRERECQRNLELMWLTGRLAPDFKTIADFRRDNGTGIRNVCRRFVEPCGQMKLFSQAVVAIDGSKFKAVNGHDRNVTPAKIQKRREQIEENIHRYLVALDTADRTLGPTEFQAKAERLTRRSARCASRCAGWSTSSNDSRSSPMHSFR
jgi:transposase